MKQIAVAGGCFWGVQEYYSRLKGIVSTKTIYANGDYKNVTYNEVCNNSNHVEAVLLEYNEEITLKDIIDHLFRIINPFSLNKQGNDIGVQYRSGIYFVNVEESVIIKSILSDFQKKLDRKIMVEVLELNEYCLAENEHQDYLKKNPEGYCHISFDKIRKEELK